MKRCPGCGTIYTDDSLQFCLQDGTPLVPSADDASETETVTRPRQSTASNPPVVSAQNTRRSRKGTTAALIVVIVALVFVLLLAAGAIALWWFVRNPEQADVNNNPVRPGPTVTPVKNPSPSPSLSPSATASPSASPTPVNNEKVTREIARALATWKSDTEARDISRLSDDYADKVDYFNHNGSGKQAVLQDKSRAFSTFQSISLVISNESISVSDTDDTASAEFEKQWAFTGDHISTGKVRSQLKFRKIGGKWLITSEKDL